MTTQVLGQTIQATADDGYSTSAGLFFTNAIAFGFLSLGATDFDAFFRFSTVNLPKDADIQSAKLILTSSSVQSGAIDVTISGDDSDDATAPTTRAEYIGKSRTTANVSWTFSTAWSVGSVHDTPDITNIIAEIIGRSGWISGNALQFFIENNGAVNARREPSALTAILDIRYITPGPLEFYLLPHPQATIFTARVDGTPASPFVEIPFDTGVISTAPVAGQTVHFGTSSGGSERGIRRLRGLPTGTTSGTMEIDESDDVGPLIENNDFITIKEDFRLWPKLPRFVQDGTNVTIFEDFDEVYTDQNSNWRPVAVAGPPGVAFLEAGQAQISFVGDRSFPLAPSTNISSWTWAAEGSVEGSSVSTGTEAAPVVFTWNSPGWYLVSLTVGDSNGKSHTNYTWAIIVNPADPTATAFLDFDVTNDTFDFEQGGGECSFVVFGDASISNFPEESLIVHATRGDITTPTGSWPFRTNVLFAGWILADTVRQNPTTGDVSFQAATIDRVMRNLAVFPVSLTNKNTATSWTEATNMFADRAASFLWHNRSTLSLMTSIRPSNYAPAIGRQDFGPTDLYSQLQNELISSILGRVVSSPQGVLYHTIDYNLRIAAERNATIRKTLHKGVWANDVVIEEASNYAWRAKRVTMSGLLYPGGEVTDLCPNFSEAPGDAPKSYGKEANFDRLIIDSQNNLNIRCGHALERLTQQFPVYRMQFVNDGSFTTVPQELFPANIEAGDNDRAISFTGNLIVRRISRSYDHVGGFFITSVDFEPEVEGEVGTTVIIDCTPPDQNLPTNSIPTPPDGIDSEVKTALVASTTGSSFYFQPGLGETWDRRVEGLLGTQLAMLDMIPDPWSAFKQGAGAEKTICWGAGKGFLARTKDSGKLWSDRTSYLDVPAWSGETGNTISNVSLLGLEGDIFNEDHLFVLASWQYTGGGWHGAVAKTTDGFRYTWTDFDDIAQVKPIGLSLDKGAGTLLYITTWESEGPATGSLYVRKYSAGAMSFIEKSSLGGGVTAADVDSQTWFAHPQNRLMQAQEVFIFGRMNNPQELTGTVQIIRNPAAGVSGSWSVIAGWGDDAAGSFGADQDGNYYGVRQGV